VTFTWTYDPGTSVVTWTIEGVERTFHVAAGGRVMTFLSRDPSYSELAVLTRLQ
jgi:hypothetical protein